MSATFTPYFEAQAHRDPTGSAAYIRVRVPDGPRPDGSILIYLPNGTGLVVNSSQLLHLDAGPNWPGEPDGRTSAERPSVGGADPVTAPSALPAAERGQVAARLTASLTASLSYVLSQRIDAVIIALILAASAGLDGSAPAPRSPALGG